MKTFIDIYKDIWGDNPSDLLAEYNYHPILTAELDRISPDEFDLTTLLKIVLWKTSRYPYISEDVLESLREIGKMAPENLEASRGTLEALLRTNGIALPMASTILRFLNPKTFQIIDDRAYRVLFPGKKKYPTKPAKVTQGFLDRSIDIYFQYLERLREISCDSLPFELSDRILYQLDIKLENQLGTKLD